MKLSRERKVYVAALVLGLCALGVDRVTRGGGTDAETASESAAIKPITHVSAAPASRPVVASGRSSEIPVDAIAHRLQAARRVDRVRGTPTDLFQVPAKWAGTVAHAAPPAAPNDADRFRATYHLTGVLISPQGNRAIINGRSVRVGETLAGFRLVSVDVGRAVLDSGRTKVILSIEAPASARPAPNGGWASSQ
jgi:hypothetical protein